MPTPMGRHRQRAAFWQLGREPALLAGLVLAVVAGSVAAVRLASSPPPAVEPTCAGPARTLTVGADPSAATWLSTLAAAYTAAGRVGNGRCVAVAVRSLTLSQAQQALPPVPLPGGGVPPDVWVPESTTSVDLARARPDSARVLAVQSAGIASSPIVLAAPGDTTRILAGRARLGQSPTLADLLALARSPAGWGQPGIDRPEWGPVRFSTPDPGTTTLGASLVVAAAGALTGTPARNVRASTFGSAQAKQGLLAFVRALASAPPDASDLFARVEQASTTTEVLSKVGVLAAYEKDVWTYNGGSPAVLLRAAYPLGGQLAADYPFLVPNASWVDAVDRKAAADFRGWLMSADVQARLGGFGLRRADGTAGPELGADGRGLTAEALPPQPLRAADGPAAALSAWRLVTRRVSVLALFDVSESMAKRVPGSARSKLDVAKAAAQASLSLFDDADAIGLWEFSRTLDGDRDYRVLVPLGLAGAPVGGFRDRRVASVAAYRTMAARTATGLYDSVLAAYQNTVSNYRQGYINTLVVLTDGKNEDPGSIPLPVLLAELKKRYDPARPVHIVTLAYGDDADRAVLGQLAEVTGGLGFTSVDPRNIGQVFLTAVAALAG